MLATYRKDGTALVSPVWFRHHDGAFEVVIAEGDVKLRHLARDPRCSLVVFEAVPPFRGVEVRGIAELVECDVGPIRADIAGRYLGAERGRRFAAERTTPASSSASAATGGSGTCRRSFRRDRRARRFVSISAAATHARVAVRRARRCPGEFSEDEPSDG